MDVAFGTFAARANVYASRGRGDPLRTRSVMETLKFILENLPAIGQRTIQHISIVGVAVGLAILTGVPIGILITQSKRAADIVLYIASMIMTIPSIALFGVMIPVLSLIGQGIGYLPAVIAVLLYSQLPIIRNTYTAISNVDPALREAAQGMGMSALQRLWQGELPRAGAIIMGRRRGRVHQPRHLADGFAAADHRRPRGQPARDHRRLPPARGADDAHAERA